jgi:phospholipid/cholesterol/gamma-HCH transport system substrate-binding protein
LSFSTQQPFKSSWKDKALGAAILVSIAFSVYWYHSKSSVLDAEKWLSADAFITQSYGIGSDAPIRLAGVTVGKVDSVDLTNDGKVKLTLSLDKQYKRFFRADSSLKIDSQLGLNSVLSGSNLLLDPGVSTIGMSPQATLTVTEPQSIEQLLAQYNITEFAEKANNMLTHLDTISGAISENQQALQSTIVNAASASQSLAESSALLPELIEKSGDLLNQVNNSIESLTPSLVSNMENLDQSMVITQQLMEQIQTLVISVDDVTNKTPQTLDATNATLEEVRLLTQQLRGHWLLDDNSENEKAPLTPSTVYPTDWSEHQRQVLPAKEQDTP